MTHHHDALPPDARIRAVGNLLALARQGGMMATAQGFDVDSERTGLGAMGVAQLRERYRQLSGDESRSRNRQYLILRILWMQQAGAYGGLSSRALELADGLARGFDVRATAPLG